MKIEEYSKYPGLLYRRICAKNAMYRSKQQSSASVLTYKSAVSRRQVGNLVLTKGGVDVNEVISADKVAPANEVIRGL